MSCFPNNPKQLWKSPTEPRLVKIELPGRDYPSMLGEEGGEEFHQMSSCEAVKRGDEFNIAIGLFCSLRDREHFNSLR